MLVLVYLIVIAFFSLHLFIFFYTHAQLILSVNCIIMNFSTQSPLFERSISLHIQHPGTPTTHQKNAGFTPQQNIEIWEQFRKTPQQNEGFTGSFPWQFPLTFTKTRLKRSVVLLHDRKRNLCHPSWHENWHD